MFEGLNAGDKDFSSIIQKLKQNNVDFVYYGGYHPELGLILRQAKEKGLNAKFMGPEGVGNDSISQIAQNASEGLLVTLPKSFDADPANKAIVDAIKADGKDPSGPFVFPAYSAVQLIAEGIKSAKSEDTDKVAAAIHAGTFKTPTGDLSYDDKGDLKDFKFVVYEWHFGKPKTEVSPQ
ncbi:Leucine-, isoleucine-, valine-, threonine-, and alanine-binding protein precursor [compost metagenome]